MRGLIADQGYCFSPIQLPDTIRKHLLDRNWVRLDQAIRAETVPGGVIFDELLKYAEFNQIEFIISIRSSLEAPDEDGIWHDDGTRFLAFSLSLNLVPDTIKGGRLEIRRQFLEDSAPVVLPTPPYGTMIVFATGHQGFEHKINRVSGGERIIIAGWCT